MNLRLILAILLLYPALQWGQNYSQIDATIVLYPSRVETPEELSAFISRDFNTEDEKVRAIYSWIIHNIAYNPEEYKKFNYNFKSFRERNLKEEKTRKKIIERTLQHGVAVCEGYAMVFEKLCELQGISNYVVRGDIKTNFDDIGRPFKNVHMWNVAYIEDRPYLFDPTWGAGKYRGKFIKEPSYTYFKADPKFLAKTHFPQQEEDLMLSESFSKAAFATLPILIDESLFLDHLLLQKKGIISSNLPTGSIPFKVYSPETEKVSYRFSEDIENVAMLKNNGYLEFEIPIQLGYQNLLIYFDNQPALGYKIE